MKFSELAGYLDKLEKTPSRLEITKILSELFKETNKNEIDKVCYLILGILAPNYEGVLLNLAEKMMLRVVARAYGVSEDKVKAEYKKAGDIGNVAQELSKSKGKDLTVVEVYEALINIAKDSGGESVERKISGMSGLLARVDSLSARFISRIPVGKLRLGFSEKTIIVALASGNESLEKQIEEAYNIRPDIGYVAKLAKSGNLKSAKPEVGVPVVPMLPQRLNSTTEMIKKMGEVSVEPKFDGLRIFIHYKRSHQKGGTSFLKIFTRNMNSIDENVFPELKDFGKYIKASEIILDTEAVGLDPKRQMFVDFQKTVSRRRKHEIEKNSTEIPLQFQVFDVLLSDGKNFLRLPYTERRKEIEKVVINGKLMRVDEHTITKNPETIRKLHEKYLKMGLEGVVVKRAAGLYVSGRTGWNWVKMKEEEGQRGRLTDTIDCVIMGFSVGKGKRAGFGVGQFLAGIKDGDSFKTITKVGTGITDEKFRELNTRLKKLVTKEKPKEYDAHKDLFPDFWVSPNLVVELAADEITVSPKHTAGFALRFPRLIRIRNDKSASQATTLNELRELLKLQKN